MEVYKLANIKSAKKRILVNQTKAARNKSIRSAVKTSIKKVEAAVAKKDKAAAEAALTEAISTISRATAKGVYHKNNCARKVSRLTKAVNSIG
ncbi:MAG: 30S ribosomal protein S20 [Blautia sp.]|nr:30S ribosomal protein S20 [Blautia sp.]